MKIVPILAITNALALGLAIFVYVKQGESHAGTQRAEVARTDAAEIAQLRMEIEDLRRSQSARVHAPAEAVSGTPDAAAPAVSPKASDVPFASRPPEAGAPEPGAAAEEFDPQEMQVFRKKVRKAQELNGEEDQENGIKERVDQLVKENKIAPLTPAQKDGVAKIVLSSRRKGMDAFRRLRESGTLETGNREERGRIMRLEMDNLRAETQRALEEIMPAADVKTYLDETTRDMGRFGGFGGGGPMQTVAPPTPGR